MIFIDISPIAFSIGPVTVRWYGIMVALAVLTLIIWTLRAVRKSSEFDANTVFSAALAAVPAGIIGARLFHVVDFWSYYAQHPAEIIGGAGLAIFGAVIGAAGGIWLYCRFSKNNFGRFVDLAAPGIILAQAVGRVGCILNGCCYGIECDLPWAITYTHQSFNRIIGPVHPTQAYEIIYNLIAFFVLLKLRGRLRPDGSLFLAYLALYALWRFGVDFIREGKEFFFFGLHEAQVVSAVVLLVAVVLMAWRTRWVKREG